MPAMHNDFPVHSSPAHNDTWVDVECVGGGAATVYLLRPLSARDMLELYRIPNTLPPSVSTLRLQLRGTDVDALTMKALRTLVRMWRCRGAVHVVFVGRLAASAPQHGGVPAHRAVLPDPSSAAATAAFL